MTSLPAIMPIEAIPDWEERLARQDAFWDKAIIDRPVVEIIYGKDPAECPAPVERTYASQRERWMDAERVAEEAVARVQNTAYFGDALPRAWPNLGPEVFSAFFGMEMEYTETTSWGVPIIEDWADTGHVRFSEDNVYWRKLEEMTDALLAAGEGLFYVGLSDLHPGGDALAAFRDPMDLNTDLVLTPTPIKEMLAYVTQMYKEVYDRYFQKLRTAGHACTTWLGIVSSKKWYVPSNDFSCMVSEAMFEEFFLPGIIDECEHMEASIYHLDGPDALRHLDSLLGIDSLNAIQWVAGAGRGGATDWIPVYKRCQAAGKGIQLHAGPDELDCLFEHLDPHGVWLGVGGIQNAEEAEHVLRRVAKWR